MDEILSLTFKDTERSIDINLNSNTLFFGNNGRGKTRILKTIYSLYDLANKNSLKDISIVIEKMYLNDLVIAGYNCKELFVNNEKYIKRNNDILTDFLNHNTHLFSEIYKILSIFRNRLMHGVSKRLYFYVNDYGHELIEVHETCYKIQNRDSKGLFNHLREFEAFMNKLSQVVRSINPKSQLFGESTSSGDEMTDNADVILQLIMINYQQDVINKNMNHKIDEELIKNQKKISKKLSAKKAYYLTTEDFDIKKVMDKIEKDITKINSKLLQAFWEDESKNSLEDLMNLNKEICSKFNLFNEILSKYGNIKIEYYSNLGIKFKKNNNEIVFENLSSGERKISYLFLELLFNDADIFLIDEPEISISLNFQNKLVGDIHRLTEGKVLFLATHAPFIYEDFKRFRGNIVKEVD